MDSWYRSVKPIGNNSFAIAVTCSHTNASHAAKQSASSQPKPAAADRSADMLIVSKAEMAQRNSLKCPPSLHEVKMGLCTVRSGSPSFVTTMGGWKTYWEKGEQVAPQGAGTVVINHEQYPPRVVLPSGAGGGRGTGSSTTSNPLAMLADVQWRGPPPPPS